MTFPGGNWAVPQGHNGMAPSMEGPALSGPAFPTQVCGMTPPLEDTLCRVPAPSHPPTVIPGLTGNLAHAGQLGALDQFFLNRHTSLTSGQAFPATIHSDSLYS
jgi:hypothetical protein